MEKTISITIEENTIKMIQKNISTIELLGILRYLEKHVWVQMYAKPKPDEPEKQMD